SFPGHTEYLANAFGLEEHLMFMIGNQMRVGLVTGHLPLRSVPDALSTDRIMRKLELMNQSLVRDFGIEKPRIAVLGVNPHAGDDGLLGSEEKEIILPAVTRAFEKGMAVFGPYPPDGFFGSLAFQKFDGILAMYHDQGLIPFKLHSFHEGVNYTAGLPVVRTSPAHGTGYDIAGKDQASSDSMREAIYLAYDIFHHRTLHDELKANALDKR
ncbi:MAG TPA: 4-hydroxythreonine-4-phosphate dehydrogenase PdxA, partial [Bacteroidales bacterium]|nr:4-hydroxythreonine-4-phosphate dehydrogenase PdxA [Bacteroidales bacterium]